MYKLSKSPLDIISKIETLERSWHRHSRGFLRSNTMIAIAKTNASAGANLERLAATKSITLYKHFSVLHSYTQTSLLVLSQCFVILLFFFS